ncbi:protein PXR1 [Drosophila santomea]|uniref:protein PXR1 n=1 Tax=Drosophila santomea TaxID=129105 RepID=UPI0019532029|nr:protein PXR1 [Drosophila santomea]
MKFKILIDGKNIVRVECPGYATQRFCVKVHAGRITLENVFPNRGGFTRGGAYITASKPKTGASKKSVERPSPEPVRRGPIQFGPQDEVDVYMDTEMRQPCEGQRFGSQPVRRGPIQFGPQYEVDVYMDTEMRQPCEGQRFGSQGLGGYGDRLFKLDVWQPIPASREVVKNAASRRKTLSRKKENFPSRGTITKKKQFDESSMPTATSTPHQKRRKTGLLSETTEREPTQKVYIPSLRVDQTIILGKRNADGLSIRLNLVKAEAKQRSQDLTTNPLLNDLGKHQVTTSNGQPRSASLKSLEREQKRLTKKIEKKMAKKKIEKKMAKKIEEMKMANEKKEKREMLRQKMVKEEKERKMMLRQKMVKEKMAKIAKKMAKEKMAEMAKKMAKEKMAKIAKKMAKEKMAEMDKKMAKEKMAKIAKKMAKEKMAKIAKKMAKEKMAKQMVRKKMEKEKMAKKKTAKQLRDIMKNLINGKN